MSKSNTLYLLKYKDSSCFKIGIANDVFNRAIALGGADQFKLSESCMLTLPSERDAFKIEQILHYLYNSYNIQSPDCIKSGLTEWFDSICFNDVLISVKGIMDKTKFPGMKLQYGLVIPKTIIVPKIVHKIRLTKLEKNIQYEKDLVEYIKISKIQVQLLISKVLEIEPYLKKIDYKTRDYAKCFIYRENTLVEKFYNDVPYLSAFCFKSGKSVYGINILSSMWQDNVSRSISFSKMLDFEVDRCQNEVLAWIVFLEEYNPPIPNKESL